MGTGVFELGARCGNRVSVATAGVVTAAAGAHFEAVAQFVGVSCKGNSVAIDGHGCGHAVEPDKGAIGVSVAGEGAAGRDGAFGQVGGAKRLEAAGGGCCKRSLSSV